MTRLADHETRCRGIGCRLAETCERHRQLGRDEMAPKGTLPARVPVLHSMRSPLAPCAFRIVPAGPAKEGEKA